MKKKKFCLLKKVERKKKKGSIDKMKINFEGKEKTELL